MGAPYLVIEGLKQRYGTSTVLDIDELVVERGEVLAVIGANGAGKSTLLRLVAQLEKPVAGRITFNGSATGELDIRRRLAMVFQESLLFTSTVFDNIAYGLRVRKVPREEVGMRVNEVAGLFGISHLLERPSGGLSGGEAQRVSLARALVLKPELLLLDEPMASLDPPTKESLLADLQRILGEWDMTVLYVTHHRTEAIILADRLAVMDEGKVVQVGARQEVMSYPVSQKVADLVGVETVLKGCVVEVSGGVAVVKINGHEIEVVQRDDLAEKVWVFIRPENVIITAEETRQKDSVRNRFRGEIDRIVDLGWHYRVVVDCGFPLSAYVTKRSVEEMGLARGQKVWASFKATSVHVASREQKG